MKKLAALIRQENAELARLEAISMGRPVSQYIDAHAAVGHFEHYAESWVHIQGTSSVTSPGVVTMTWRQPYGVAAAIVPWNLPLLFFSGKCAPALAAGNCVVVKSSEKAPLAIARVAELIVEAGFPPGVFNVLSGHGVPSGQALARHMDIRVLSFTGSCRTGRLIQEEAARSNLKKVILELGGKSPALVFADADLDKAAKDTAKSVQWNSGQTCFANSRVYVAREVAAEFVELFKKHFSAITAGDPTDPAVDHGPQADEIQYRNVMRYIEKAKSEYPEALKMGGEGSMLDTAAKTKTEEKPATNGTITNGTAATNGNSNGDCSAVHKRGGYFVQPTVFLDIPDSNPFMREEVFGPVVGLGTFETEEEAIKRANDTEFGLYAAIYTRDLSRALRVAKALESGYVGVNCTSPFGTSRDLPFGGYKSSGQGREGWLYSLDNFLETKSVLVRL